MTPMPGDVPANGRGLGEMQAGFMEKVGLVKRVEQCEKLKTSCRGKMDKEVSAHHLNFSGIRVQDVGKRG